MKKLLLSTDGHNIPLIHEKSTSNTLNRVTILTHGIFTDMHEKGRFDRFASRLLSSGSDVIRFDFRGHGESDVLTEKFNTTGALTDLVTVANYVTDCSYSKINMIGSSFGASIILLYFALPNKINIAKLVLLNPVVDYMRTFISADLAWGRDIFSDEVQTTILKNGSANVVDNFQISLDFYNQLIVVHPYDFIHNMKIPTLVFHGDEDDKVSHKISLDYFSNSKNITIDIVKGAGHAFKTENFEEYVHEQSVTWLANDQ